MLPHQCCALDLQAATGNNLPSLFLSPCTACVGQSPPVAGRCDHPLSQRSVSPTAAPLQVEAGAHFDVAAAPLLPAGGHGQEGQQQAAGELRAAGTRGSRSSSDSSSGGIVNDPDGGATAGEEGTGRRGSIVVGRSVLVDLIEREEEQPGFLQSRPPPPRGSPPPPKRQEEESFLGRLSMQDDLLGVM